MLLAVVAMRPRVHRVLVPATRNLLLSSAAPSVTVGVGLSPAAANLLLSGSAPTLSIGASLNLAPAAANLLLSGTVPSVVTTGGAGATPTFRSGSTATTTANVSTLDIAYPAGLANNDILILAVNFAADGETVTTPAGFTQIGNTESPYSEDAGANDMHSACYWKRADGTETGNLTITKSGAGGGLGIFYAAFAAYQGCLQSGSPIDGTSDVTDATTPYTMGSITTAGANRRAVCVFCIEDNEARSTGPASGWTQRVSLISGIGLDGTVVIDDIEQASAGSPVDDFFGASTNQGAGIHAFALKPEPAG